MAHQDFSSLTLTAIQAALKAGDILRKGFGTLYEVIAKPGRQNFVTQYDHESEACIISLIKDNFPTHSILAEESGLLNQTKEETILWIVDPLDGTTNFAHHLPLFTISIAAYQNDKGLCGVIYQPLTHELFVAERGRGAYLNGKRLTVSQTQQLEECLIVAGLPYEMANVPTASLEYILQLVQKGVTLRNLGSAALALAYVAAGKADAFWMHHLYPWDLAAGKILIEEAGGEVSRYDGLPIPLHTPSSILATNRILHQPLLDYLSI
jgi:myo-inositol-1(or 4)-monophosphatase